MNVYEQTKEKSKTTVDKEKKKKKVSGNNCFVVSGSDYSGLKLWHQRLLSRSSSHICENLYQPEYYEIRFILESE